MDQPAAVTDLAFYPNRRESRISEAAAVAARSQQLYERMTAKATAARRQDFSRALQQGLSLAGLATAVGLGTEEVEAILDPAVPPT
jgi:hypothetical protein